MSDKLAISAALSVLMMSAYVLLSGDAARAPLSASGVASPLQIEAPRVPMPDFGFLPLLR